MRLPVSTFVFMPPGEVYNLTAAAHGARLLVYERIAGISDRKNGKQAIVSGMVEEQPVLDVGAHHG
jgi:hypothetical protein